MGKWAGVDLLLSRAGESRVPETKTAVFVGTEFDSLAGRGGDDGTPVRKTPWGEIAWQLGGARALALVAVPTDPVITLGTAPLHDPMLRAAVFEQLGETRLEAAVTTDVAGKDHAHALRLDAEGTAEVKKARLHGKVATSIFFESNGGQQKAESSLAEVRLAVAEPDLDVGNVEQCLEALTDTCYYLTAKKNRYRFSFQPNLNKLLADRRATVSEAAIHEQVRSVVQKVFAAGPSSLDQTGGTKFVGHQVCGRSAPRCWPRSGGGACGPAPPASASRCHPPRRRRRYWTPSSSRAEALVWPGRARLAKPTDLQ